MECLEYVSLGEPPRFNYDVRSSYQNITVWGGLCVNGSILGPSFFDNNFNGMAYLDMLNEASFASVIPRSNLLYGHFEFGQVDT